MGQHVGTALARILADEIEAECDKVAIVHVDSDPKWRTMVTGGSWSVWQSFPVLSCAGVAPDRCVARNGAAVCGKQSIAYGDVVARGDLNRVYTPDELQWMLIKPLAERRLIGRDGARPRQCTSSKRICNTTRWT
jgi:isoquinoline 1-oxidoreductase subunit beta